MYHFILHISQWLTLTCIILQTFLKFSSEFWCIRLANNFDACFTKIFRQNIRTQLAPGMSLLHPIIRKALGAFRWNLLLANIFSIAELWSNSSCGAECHKHQGHTKRNMWNKPRAVYLLFAYSKTPFERDVLDFWYLKSIGYYQLLKQKEKSCSNCWLLMDQFLYHVARVLTASKLAPKNCTPYRIDSFLSSIHKPPPLFPPRVMFK